jgi:hypothetical protein
VDLWILNFMDNPTEDSFEPLQKTDNSPAGYGRYVEQEYLTILRASWEQNQQMLQAQRVIAVELSKCAKALE